MFAWLIFALPFLLVAAWLAWRHVKRMRASKRESRERRDALEELELCEPETDFGFADCPNRLDEPKSLARDMAETVRKSAPLLVCALVLTACGPMPQESQPEYCHPSEPMERAEGMDAYRFRVTFCDSFRDLDSYTGRRSIYLIRDSVTGAEFVGISGIGISELGAHYVGKLRQTDER